MILIPPFPVGLEETTSSSSTTGVSSSAAYIAIGSSTFGFSSSYISQNFHHDFDFGFGLLTTPLFSLSISAWLNATTNITASGSNTKIRIKIKNFTTESTSVSNVLARYIAGPTSTPVSTNSTFKSPISPLTLSISSLTFLIRGL